MTRNEANAYLIAILETVAETGWAPEGIMYAGLMGEIDLSEFQTLMEIARRGGLLKVENHVATITDKGLEIVAAIAKHRAARA